MNDDLQLADDQLRLATSRTLPSGARLDAETSLTRDGFLSLGAALESASADLDEAALVSRLSRERTCSRSETPSRVWPFLLCGALAASALLAIVRIIAMLPEDSPKIAVVSEPNRAMKIQQSSPALAWNDPLDDEIALAAATLEQYRSPSPTFDNSLFDMNIQLEALSQELLRESL